MMFNNAPNGYFLRDLIVFNGLSEGGCVAKGFIFEPPDLANTQVSELNDFQDQLSLLLASLGENQRLQVQYFCDSDFRKELLRYNDETKRAVNQWTQRCRNERFERYWKAMTERRLRRQRLVFYLTRRIESSVTGIKSKAALNEFYENLLDQLRAEFEQVHEMLTTIFCGQGARITAMKDADHFRHYKMFLNPSLADRFDYDPIDGFDPAFTIQENCWHCEGNGQSDFGFFMDGHYHSMIVLSRWPKTTYPGIIHRLTNLRLLDYSITVNIDPLPVRKEIYKEEKEHDRVAGDYASEKKLSLLTVMEKKQRKIAALMQGHTFPFHVLFAVRVWDKSREGLIAKTTAIKNAINGLNSAQYSESTLPSTSRKLFFQTWPGWTWGRYDAWKLYGENRYIADMLPIASTFSGHLETAEALYEGANQNLIGVKTFGGQAGNQSPQHAVLLGMSGAGKSVTICDLLSQTESYFAYTVIIEEGLSYGIYTQTVEPEAKPIVIQPDGDISINYLDIASAWLTPEEYPTHRMLQELMALDASGPERDQIIELSTLLLPWCRDGNYGCLFDGTSNLSLTGKIAHFELGCIPDAARELRAAAGFLITNYARKHIITLPRALRKRNVYEEVARFLDIPGGEEIVKESYAQLRKFNCWNISIVQQYARFKQSRIRSAVFGNSRQFFLMRQNDRADLDDIGQDIALPEVTRHAIMNHPLPDHQAGQKYAAFTYFHLDANRPICGTVHYVTSDEMLYCSSSSGEHFEKRAKELRRSTNIVEGILAHSRKNSELIETT